MNNETTSGNIVLRASGLKKSYFRGAEVPVLRGVDLCVRKGEFLSIIGLSGSGKSTLLHLLGLLDQPDSGSILWDNQRIDNQPARARDRYRNSVVGFVFQFYHLLPELDTLENVLLPAMIRLSLPSYLTQRGKLRKRAQDLLERVGLGHRMYHRPGELSGGEMQRAAIARALFAQPEILLADEPTGNLDPDTGESVLATLSALQRETKLTVVMVTHNHELAHRGDRVLRLVSGQLEPETILASRRAV